MVSGIKAHNQHGVGALDIDDYEFNVVDIPNSYYCTYPIIIDDGEGNLTTTYYFSQRYDLSCNGETINLFIRHITIDTSPSPAVQQHKVYLIKENKLNMLQITNGSFNVLNQYPWALQEPLLADYFDGSHTGPTGPNYLERGEWRFWISETAGLPDADYPAGASTHSSDDYRRILHISLAPTGPTVGSEIVDGGVYRIWLTKAGFKNSDTPPIYYRRIISVIGTNSLIGYPAGHALSGQCAMTYDYSQPDTSAIESEWTVGRVAGSADIVLTANSVEMKVSAHPVNDLGSTYPDINIGANKLFLVASGTTGITASGLVLPSGGANGYYIRGTDSTTSTTYEMNSDNNSWSNGQLDPLHWDNTLNQCEVFFEPITSSGIP
jgi:hypothetical protein